MKQITIHEKWRKASEEPGAGIRFHEAPKNAKPVDFIGFTDEELRRILGSKKLKEHKERNTDVIEEV
jgi:hypothetical protein